MSRLTPFRQDVFCVLLFAVFGLALWIPVLGVVTLNPDESQYEATASYLVGSGVSAFLPSGIPGMFGLFKLATLLIGPYPIFAMRVLVLSVALATALMLFWILRRETNRWCGLVAGLVFLHLVIPFEGFVVNREWFSTLVTMLGLTLYFTISNTERRRPWLLFASGFLCALALWFKFQSSFITLVVPTVMLVEALTSRCMKNLVRDLAWFAAGGIGAGIVYVVPFVLNGILGQFLDLMFTDFELYVDVDGAAVRHSGLERFAIDVPHRALFLIAYAMTAIVVARWVVRLFRSDRRSNSLEPRSGLSLFVAYLLLSMVCVQLGNRFYAHYFQLMVPAVAALTGYALYFFARSSEGRPGRRVAAAAVAALLVIERFPLLSSETLWPGVPRSPETLPALAFVLGALAVMAYWLQRPLRRAGFAAACLILIHTGVLVVQQQLTPRPATMSHSPYRFAELSEYFAREARPGDRLFVWGWAPEIYSLTRLEAGSHITFCQFVVNDIAGVSGPPAFNPVWEKMLMNELGASRPRFIVDASSSSWFETKAGIYDLRNYPDFELNSLLDMHYRQVARLDDCPVWERR